LSPFRCVAFDGDADRIVYYLPDKEFKNFLLLDGDRIICLFATFFKSALDALKQTVHEIKDKNVFNVKETFNWKIGMV